MARTPARQTTGEPESGRTRRRRRALAVGAVAAGAALVAAVAPASAAIIDRGVEQIDGVSDPFSCDLGTEDPADDLWLVAAETGTIRYQLKERGDGLIVWSGHGDIHRTWTNLDTGLSWSGHDQFYEHDTRALSFDGGVLEMLVTTSFRVTIYDGDGDVHSVDRGVSRFTLLIDTKGTDTFDDDEVDFGEQLSVHGHLTVGDFCEDAVLLTT
jgi:hypothetical protein